MLWRRFLFAIALVAVSTSVLTACGDDQAVESPEDSAAHATGNFLVIVRVEDRLAGGEWLPMADVTVEYELLGSGSDSNKVLQKFSHVTDANGYSVVFRDTGDLEPRQIGVVFADLKAPDNRARGARMLSASKFDFAEFFARFLEDPQELDEAVGQVCAAAANPAHCETVLNENGLQAWGAGILVQLTPIRER